MTLYQIDELLIKAIELGYDPETGEILDESALDELQMERDKKIESMCLYVKDLRAEASAINDEQMALGKRKHARLRKADAIERLVQNSLQGEKFKTSKCEVKYRMSDAVNITNVIMIPDEYMRTNISTEPDKVAIKKALKAGESVPGATLDRHNNMSIT